MTAARRDVIAPRGTEQDSAGIAARDRRTAQEMWAQGRAVVRAELERRGELE